MQHAIIANGGAKPRYIEGYSGGCVEVQGDHG
jgi:hypothetical protein